MDTKRKTTHRTRQEMFSLVTTWKTSGIPQKDFCNQNHIPYSVFQYWVKKFKDENLTTDTAFIELKPPAPTTPSPEMEIVFPSGATVIFRNHPDPAFIRSLVYDYA